MAPFLIKSGLVRCHYSEMNGIETSHSGIAFNPREWQFSSQQFTFIDLGDSW